MPLQDPLVLNPGDLRHSITIEAPSVAGDAFGSGGGTWQAILNTRASIQAITQRELTQDSQTVAQVTHIIKIRYPGATVSIMAGCRVLQGTAIYQVQTVENVQNRNRVVKMMCLAIDASSLIGNRTGDGSPVVSNNHLLNVDDIPTLPESKITNLVADLAARPTIPVTPANGGTGTSTVFTTGSIPVVGASGVYTQDNDDLFYNETGYSGTPTLQLGPRLANPIDATFEVYNSTAGSPMVHFHSTSAQGVSGGAAMSLSSVPAGQTMLSGNQLGSLRFAGASTTSQGLSSGAAIESNATQNWAVGQVGANLTFKTAANNTSTRLTALTIDQDQSASFTGDVGIGITATTDPLTVGAGGNVYFKVIPQAGTYNANQYVYVRPGGSSAPLVVGCGAGNLALYVPTGNSVGVGYPGSGAATLSVNASTTYTNTLTVSGAANGSAPNIAAAGSSDANVNINLTPKGTGVVVVNGTNGQLQTGNALGMKLCIYSNIYGIGVQSGLMQIITSGDLGLGNGTSSSFTQWMTLKSGGNVGINCLLPTSKLQVVGLPVYANNAAAIAGGLTVGAFYRTGADPDPVCVVH